MGLKKAKFIFLFVLGVITISPILVSARSITNINGIEISENEYNNFLKVHSNEYIMTMTQADYDKLKSLDYSNVQDDTRYILSTYNEKLRLTTEEEITEEEYENFDNEAVPYMEDGTAGYETTAKKLSMALVGGTTWNYVMFSATWKGIPKTRSFDVIGLRGVGLEFREGSQTGKQIYVSNGKYNMINYSWNGTNIKRLNNGFGISMNIVNDDIDALQLEVDCDVKQTETYPAIFASYQHAVANLSLANSQNYTLGNAGLGDVFIYPYSIVEKYDGMSGIRIQYYS